MRAFRSPVLLLLTLAAVLCASEAVATTTINKQFTPATIDPGDISRMRVSVFNSSLVSLTAAAVTDNLPAAVTIRNPPNVTDTCAFASVTATPGTSRLIASGGTIPAGTGVVDGSCYIEFDVVSTTAGNWTNTIPRNGPSNGFTPGGTTSGYQATEGGATVTNTTDAIATLSVRSLSNPTGSKTFAPSPGLVGEPITLTIVLTNPNAASTIPLTNFTDPLPAGLVVAAVPGSTIVCTGTGAANGTVAANSGDTSVVLNGGTIGGGGTCTLTVKVVANSITGTTQNFTNTVPANAIGNIRLLSSASFNRSETVNSPITTAKAFTATVGGGSLGGAPIVAGQEAYARVDIGNSSTTNPLTIMSFTDNLPVGLVVGTLASNIDCVTNGGGTNGTVTATPGATSFTVTGAIVGTAGGTRRCRVFVSVVASAAGPYTNNIPANAVTNPGSFGSPAANATLNVNSQLTVAKTVVPSTAAPGQPVTFTITISNYSSGPVSGVTFTDTLPLVSGNQMVVSNPNGFATSAGCSGGTFTNAPGSATLAWSGGTIVGGVGINPGVCTITFKANAPLSATIGQVFTNTLSAGSVTATGSSGGVSNPVGTSVNVTMVAAASVAKAFAPNNIVQNGTSTLTVTLSNQTAVALTNAALTDTLPGGMTIAAVPATSTTCAGGVVSAAPLGGSASISGATIPANGNCNFKVNVTGTTVGTLTNSIPAGALTNDQASSNPAVANANLTVTSGLTATKTFTPASVANGGVSQIDVRITNPSSIALSNVSMTDGPMTNLSVANPAQASTTCAGSPVITAVPGSATVTMTGANIAAGGNCDVLFNVVTTGNPANWPNTIPIGGITTAEGDRNTAAVSATLGKVSGVSIGINKSFNPVSVAGSQPSTLQIDITNPISSPVTVHNLSFTDSLPAGMEVYPVPNVSTTCTNGMVAAVPGSAQIALSGGTLGAGATCTVFVDVTSVQFLNLTNTIPVGAVATTEGLTNALATTATLSTLQGLGVTKGFLPTSVSVGQPSTLDLRLISTLDPAAPVPVTLHNVSFTDTLPASVTVAPTPNVSTTCAGSPLITAAPGGTTVTLTGVTLAPSTDCHTYVDVVGSSLGARTNTVPTGGVVSDEGYSNPAPAQATLNVVIPPTLAKAFSPTSVAPGQAARITITINNPNGLALTNVALSDALPSGLSVASTPNASTTCTGGAVAAAPAGSTVALTNGTVAANGSCVVQVDVLSNSPNSYVNTIPAGALITAQGESNVVPASATLNVLGPPGISKSFAPASVQENVAAVLTLSLQNGNASPTTLSAALTDALPGGLLVAPSPGLAGTCTLGSVTANPGATQIVYASGAVLPVGGCTISVNVVAATAGTYVNVIPAGALQTPVGSNPGPAPATLTVQAPPQADLSITKTDGIASVTTGANSNYTVTVTNNGPAGADGAILTDPAAPGLTKTGVSCTAANLAQCPAAPTIPGIEGAGLVIPVLPPGGTVSFVIATSVTGVPGSSVTNTASVAPPVGVVDPNPADNTASDTDVVVGGPDLTLAKTDGGSFVRGQAASFFLTVSNAGGTISNGVVSVTDALPGDFTPTAIGGTGWSCDLPSLTCTRSDGVAAGGSFPPIQLDVVVASTAVSNPTNSATVSGGGDTDPANNTGTDTVAVTGTPDLAITKTDGVVTVVPGSSVTYTIVASNAGPSPATGATVADTLPAVLSGATWNCVGAGGGTCTASGSGNIADTVNLPVGATVTYTLTAVISAAATGTLSNTATIAPPAGVNDPNPGNNSATDVDAISPTVDLSITKTDGSTTAVPGNPVTYTIVASNAGPSVATGATVVDTLPGTLSGAAWTCVGAGGGTCPASGAGNISASVNLPVGASVTFTLTATLSAAATGTLVNTATVTAPAGVTDPNPGNNSATDTDTLAAQVSLGVVKTDGASTYTPGGTATYTVTVSNTGLTDALNVTVTDPLPAGVTLTANATCVANGTSSCGTVSGTTGQASFGATSARVNAGAGNALTFTVPVAFASGMTANPLTNTATATDQASGASASGSDSNALAAASGLGVTKSDGSATYTPGGTATYTIVVTNAGPSNAGSVTVSDTLPAGVTLSAGATCVATGTATCGTVTGATGATAFGTTGATIAAGAGNRLTFAVPVNFSAGLTTDPLVNTVTVTDPASAPATASDSDSLSVMQADVGILKVGPATVSIGSQITYTLTITNAGPSAANGTTFDDPVPAAITGISAVCSSAAGGAACGAVTVVGNNVSGTVPVLPLGGSVVITIHGTVSSVGAITNTGTVVPPFGITDPISSNSSSSASTNAAGAAATPVPANAPWALAALLLALAILGMRCAQMRRGSVRD